VQLHKKKKLKVTSRQALGERGDGHNFQRTIILSSFQCVVLSPVARQVQKAEPTSPRQEKKESKKAMSRNENKSQGTLMPFNTAPAQGSLSFSLISKWQRLPHLMCEGEAEFRLCLQSTSRTVMHFPKCFIVCTPGSY
jgi:hypothetical protein